MAGLSISRRRKAWLDGVIFGATGRGHSNFLVPKLKEIYEHRIQFGHVNAKTPFVAALLTARQKLSPPKRPQRPVDRHRERRPVRTGVSRFDRPQARRF